MDTASAVINLGTFILSIILLYLLKRQADKLDKPSRKIVLTLLVAGYVTGYSVWILSMVLGDRGGVICYVSELLYWTSRISFWSGYILLLYRSFKLGLEESLKEKRVDA